MLIYRKAFVVILALTLAACKKTAPPPPTLPGTFFAMTIPGNGADYPTVSVGALGHSPSLAWGFIERNPGQYNFLGFDQYIKAAVANGLVDANGTAQVVLTFGYTPAFRAADTSNCSLVSGVSVCPSPPANIADWRSFVQAVISHYNGTRQPHLAYYELWNEFSSPTFWTGTNQDMVNLAAAAYPIIHQDPYSKLLTPNVSGPVGVAGGLPDGLAFMTSYLQAGGSKYADGGSFHGYIAGYASNATPFPFPEEDSTAGCVYGKNCFGSIVRKVTGFRSVFDANGLKGKPMLDTEGSWGINANVTDEPTQQAWVARWFALQAGLYPQITQASWFGWDLSGGSLSSSAGVAYNTICRWFIGASVTPCVSDAYSTWTCALMRSGGYQAVVIWNAAGSVTYTPASGYIRSRDVSGTQRQITGTITVGSLPMLLENQ